MSKLYILLILTVPFLSCKKGNSVDSGVNFVGHWQYQYQIGGQTGSKVYNQPSGTTTILILNSDKTYQKLTNNNIQQQGTYDVNQVKSFFTGNSDNAINFDSSGIWKIATVQKDTLSIADNFADGYSQVYVKVQ